MKRQNHGIVSSLHGLQQTVRAFINDFDETLSMRSKGSPVLNAEAMATNKVANSGGTVELDRQLPDDDCTPAEIFAETGILPEDYIYRLVEDADGRLDQQQIVNRTGWSEATVSRRLSAMEENGDITRFKVGRKNVVCLPEAVPEME